MIKKYLNIGIDSIGYVESDNTEETFIYLATKVAEDLLKKEKIQVEDIGVLIYVTQYSEFLTPSTSFLIHRNLALSKDCFQYDINQGGVGFLSGIQLICSLLLGFCNNKKALLICADYSDRIQEKRAASATLLSRQMDAEIIVSNYVASKFFEYELREHGTNQSEINVDMNGIIQKEYLLQQDNFMSKLGEENIEEEQKVYCSLEDTMMYIPKIISQEKIQGNVVLGAIGAGMSIMHVYCRIK